MQFNKRELPPLCTCGRKDGAAPVHTKRATCSSQNQAYKGSDDDYCSAYPSDGHFYVAHSVDASPLKWIERCDFCGRINNAYLREQLSELICNSCISDTTDPTKERRSSIAN